MSGNKSKPVSKFQGLFAKAAEEEARQDSDSDQEIAGRTEYPMESEPLIADRLVNQRQPSVQAQPKPMGRPPGKRSDPAWKQFSVLLQKQTQKQAANILRDKDDGSDLSDLVQILLERWIKKQRGN